LDGRQQDVHERRRCDDAVEQPEEPAEQPAAGVDGGEDRVVDQREQLARDEVEQVLFAAAAVAGITAREARRTLRNGLRQGGAA
jgi:hypothetical protein